MALDTQALIAKGSETVGFDPRKLSKRTIRMILVGGLLGLAFWKWGDHLATSFDDMVEVGYDALILSGIGIVLMIAWKQFGLLSDSISRTCLAWAIEYDPWRLQFKLIDKAEENWDKTITEKEKLVGQWVSGSAKIKEKQTASIVAVKAQDILKKKLLDTTLTKEDRLQNEEMLKDEQQKQVDAFKYIQVNQPIVEDMGKIVEIIKAGQIVMKHKIERMRSSLRSLQDTYQNSTAARNALTAMKKCLTGDNQLNDQAEQSKLHVLQEITMNIGSIRTSAEIITEITANASLQDAASMAAAREQLAELGISTDGSIPLEPFQSGNLKQLVTVNGSSYNMPD